MTLDIKIGLSIIALAVAGILFSSVYMVQPSISNEIETRLSGN